MTNITAPITINTTTVSGSITTALKGDTGADGADGAKGDTGDGLGTHETTYLHGGYDTHLAGDGSDHADVATNTAAISAQEAAGAVRSGTTAIAGTATCTIDWSTGAALYSFAKTVPVTLALSNLPAGAWGVILEITDDGGGDAVSYPANWKEIGGAAMDVTTSGIDRWLITGYGSTDTNIRVSQTLDWKAA